MKTTQLRSLGSLRAAAESRRRGFLRGAAWMPVQDRDLDRIATDLLAISQAECAPKPSAAPTGHARAGRHPGASGLLCGAGA
jgi:hypothetical protein